MFGSNLRCSHIAHEIINANQLIIIDNKCKQKLMEGAKIIIIQVQMHVHMFTLQLQIPLY